MKNLILQIDRRLTGLCMFVACALLCLMATLGIWQVVTRFVLEQPSAWSEEIMRRLMIWMVALGMVVAFRGGAMVSVDLMLRTARGSWRTFVRTTITVVYLLFLSVLAWQGFDLVSRVRFQTFASVELSMGWAYAAFPVGAVLAIVAVIAHHLDPHDDELSTAQ